MQRLDRNQDDEDEILGDEPDAAADQLTPEPMQQDITRPDGLSLGDPALVAGNVAEPAWRRWNSELAAVGGRSPLVRFVDTPRSRIELSTTHPGGLPQFITGKSTLLSSLIRDELALRNARLAAAEITQKGIELRSVRGVESVHLAIGLASWRNGGEEYLAPVLLRPLAIRRYGRDFELKLKGQPFLNPALARELRDQFQITLDADAFVALAITNGVFKPQPVIDRLRGLTSHLPWFQVAPRLVVSSFAEVGPEMAIDAAKLDHPVIDALAGNPAARAAVTAARGERVKPVGQDDRPPSTDTLLLDADPEQEQVVAEIEQGTSVVVKTLPGTGGTQTIVNAIGALVANDKRVLVVGARRASLDGIAHRLGQVGLGGAAVTTPGLRRELIQSISRNEKAERPRVADVDDALVRLRKVLLDYRTALTRPDPELHVSVLDALSELARLALLPAPPSTTARLDRAALAELATGRGDVARDLARAAELGEFRYGPGDSPWYGASFTSSAEATNAHELAKRLSAVEVPRLLERGRSLIAQTRLREFESIAELGVFLRLLLDVRETLDRFQPSVFDRPLGELIAATAPRRESGMSGANRRRLRRHALEFVRPGVHITDLNAALRGIQQQRTLWQRYSDAGAIPGVPVGIDDVHVAYQHVSSDLATLDAPLDLVGTPRQLGARPIRDLVATLAGLAADSEVLANLQERTAILGRLRELGLDPLLVDLAKRHVPEPRVADELELAWWQSVLEQVLAGEKALLGANTTVLDRLEGDFRLVDEAHASAAGPLLAWRLAENWKVALVDHPEEAAVLKRLLRGDRLRADALVTEAPNLFRVLAPVWLASPYEVSAVDDRIAFDTVILVDAGATTIAENLGAIRRAKQVVAFGDPVTQTPTLFETGIDDGETPPDRDHEHGGVDALHADSALARLGELLPTLTLTRSYRAGGEDLAELVNRRFYGGRIVSLPWAGSFLGHGSLGLHYVSGNGLPDSVTGTVESIDSEVAKVVELVMEHAVKRPRESLMVITASTRHAARVHQAVLAAFAKRTDLSDFILKDRAEPFTVLTLEQAVAQSRDRVIFSIGYGRTPHGRLLSNFGSLGQPGGDRLLAVGMTRARRSMDIVSAFRPDDIDESRQSHGVLALANVLTQTEERAADSGERMEVGSMLRDLASRLERRGIRVSVGYRGRLALAAAHAGKAVVVETDDAFAGQSLRESLRLRPDVLRRLGWHYLRVHSFELFGNPDAVAARVASVLGKPDPVDDGAEVRAAGSRP
ncbi:AAA family ATPase [Agromyces sp. H3Y2-19a]|nr:AAA family ATPase [Agromyces chromiiresistens]MDF0512821.1 AAA family ATPase [Agromyces chromiiresistens]